MLLSWLSLDWLDSIVGWYLKLGCFCRRIYQARATFEWWLMDGELGWSASSLGQWDSRFPLAEMDCCGRRSSYWIGNGIGTITLEIFVMVQWMRDCISVSGRWFYGLFEEVVDLFTIKSTGKSKINFLRVGGVYFNRRLVGRLNDGTLWREVCSD